MENCFIQVINISNRKCIYVKPESLISTLEDLKVEIPCIPDLEDLDKYSSVRVQQYVFEKVEFGKFN